VLISLCVAGLTVAAPQLDLPGVQRTVTTTTLSASGVNEDALVADVVTALEPSIAAAVANALLSLQTTSSVTSISADNSAAQISGGAVSAGFSSSSSSSTGGKAAFSAGGKSASSASAAAEKAAFEKEFAASRELAEPTTRPEYNFEFKVADSDEQTYITQQEARDGDELTGSYSYVDPTGALITVNYQAGPDGFSQTTDKQEGFVQIVAKPPRIAAASAATSSGSKLSSSSGSAGAAISSQQSFGSNSASASTLDQSALIAQILLALQPQISASVNAALTASQSRTQSVIAVPAAVAPAAPLAVRPVAQAARPVAAKAAAASGNLASLFGDGYAVRIATPEFKIEY